jgi:hypothetical protein
MCVYPDLFHGLLLKIDSTTWESSYTVGIIIFDLYITQTFFIGFGNQIEA